MSTFRTERSTSGALAFLASAVLVGCGQSSPTPTTSGNVPVAEVPAPPPNAAPSIDRTNPKPGFAVGRITQEGGKPITASGAKITVTLQGVSTKSGEKVSYTPKVNADGTYEQKLVEGSYHYFGATLAVPFSGQNFLFTLEPVGDDKSERDSQRGIVQDYVWKLTGPKPLGNRDEANFTNWYGASVNMQFQFYRNDLKKGVPKGLPGTKCVFTVTPIGPLVDGSTGKPLTFTREYDRLLTGPLSVWNSSQATPASGRPTSASHAPKTDRRFSKTLEVFTTARDSQVDEETSETLG